MIGAHASQVDKIHCGVVLKLPPDQRVSSHWSDPLEWQVLLYLSFQDLFIMVWIKFRFKLPTVDLTIINLDTNFKKLFPDILFQTAYMSMIEKTCYILSGFLTLFFTWVHVDTRCGLRLIRTIPINQSVSEALRHLFNQSMAYFEVCTYLIGITKKCTCMTHLIIHVCHLETVPAKLQLICWDLLMLILPVILFQDHSWRLLKQALTFLVIQEHSVSILRLHCVTAHLDISYLRDILCHSSPRHQLPPGYIWIISLQVTI